MTTMYSLKPIINHNVTIDRPTCMYEMKNIHGDDGDPKQKLRIVSVITGQFINSIKTPLAEVAALEARQERILAQLAELKEQVLNLCDVLKENNEIEPVVARPPQIIRAPVNEDLVLNVNPSRPCYSILALEKLWSDVSFRVSPFVHSSIKAKVPEDFKKTKASSKASVINISLIWKEVIDAELIISGTHGYAVMGETNFLRYLLRILDHEAYEALDIMKIDRVLDLSHQLTYQESPKDRQETLALLDKVLGSDEWYSGKNRPGITDVATWSSIKQSSLKKLPSNLAKWFVRCEQTLLN